MHKTIIRLCVTLFAFLSTSCGFHTPHKSSAINFNVVGDTQIVKRVKHKLHTNTTPVLTVKINNVIQNKFNQSFTKSGVAGYTLETVVDFVVYNDNTQIFANTLSASRYLDNHNSNANSYQEQKAYEDMQDEIINKIIRKVARLQ
jgi:outer membrane lipopolysaccharide assembly protein LptE/RlpB